MRILLCSHAFHPAIGGIETASLLFAKGFAERGHEVTVVTTTLGEPGAFPFKVVRRPDAATLIKLVRDANLVWHNNISLRALWPLAFIRRPLLITHQTWLGPERGRGRWLWVLKRRACGFGRNVFISAALGEAARLPGTVIPNAYDDQTFVLMPDVPRNRDIAFLGRLVPDKGGDVLIDALAILASEGLRLSATVIGDGPERDRLMARAAAAGLADLVAFPGPMQGSALTRALNRHRILAVPSRWNEPFGIVALEGAACGCVVIGSAGGGLPEAIGPCGPTVANSDPAALARGLAALVAAPERMAAHRRAAEHLARHRPSAVIEAYERVVADVIGRDRAAQRW